jgi:hypothetical protein
VRRTRPARAAFVDLASSWGVRFNLFGAARKLGTHGMISATLLGDIGHGYGPINRGSMTHEAENPIPQTTRWTETDELRTRTRDLAERDVAYAWHGTNPVSWTMEDPVPWHAIETELGIVSVRPLSMEVLSLRSDELRINRVNYLLYGPLYWLDGKWSAFERGCPRNRDPDFTLLRSNQRHRQGTHAAYRKAVAVIEPAANDWMPTDIEYATLAVESLESQLARQVVDLADWYRDPETHARFDILVKGHEEHLATLGRYLEAAKRIAGTEPGH